MKMLWIAAFLVLITCETSCAQASIEDRINRIFNNGAGSASGPAQTSTADKLNRIFNNGAGSAPGHAQTSTADKLNRIFNNGAGSAPGPAQTSTADKLKRIFNNITVRAPGLATEQLNMAGVLNLIFNNSTDTTPRPPTRTAAPSCVCVKYYLCNGTRLNRYGQGIIDIREGSSKCGHYTERCCTADNLLDEVVVPTDKTPKGCGYRRPSGVVMETKGDTKGEAKFGEFPWMVAIISEVELHSQTLSKYHCGGSLIHPRAVLAAAHCVNDSDKTYQIRAGEWDTQTTNEMLKHQDRMVKSIIIHPDYYRAGLLYDVALLILEEPVKLDQHIAVACLPQQSTVIPAGTECWASGWGKDLFGAQGAYAVFLKKIDLPFVESNTCQNRLRRTRLGKYFLLHESFVCAGGVAGKDVCKGDGGSPLVCPIPGQANRYQQVGIVSWGIGCGENGIPGVYGNVALFRNWIDTEMGKRNLDITQYQYS